MKQLLICAAVLIGAAATTFSAKASDVTMPAPACTDCASSNKYDVPNATPTRRDYEPGHPIEADMPEVAAERATATDCPGCAPRRRYDSQETVKTHRDVDQSRVINTTSYAPSRPPAAAPAGKVRVRSDVTLVNFVVHRYRVIEAPELASESAVSEPDAAPARRSWCRSGQRGRDCRPLRVRG